MESYSAHIICKGMTYNSQLHEKSLYFTVCGVKIEVELDGSLYIENSSEYTKEQLQVLSYRQQDGSNVLFLTNYVFQYTLPVKLFDKYNHLVVDSIMTGSITNSDSTNYTWSIMDAHSSASDVVNAIIELQKNLLPGHVLMVCCCCKYGQEHPYGGDAYINFLCFRKGKREYERLGSVSKTDWGFFSDEQNTEPTRPLYCCGEFRLRRCFG